MSARGEPAAPEPPAPGEASPGPAALPPAPAVHELPGQPLPGEIGTAHPSLLRAVASDGGWVVVCQARADTDGDGDVSVSVGPRGALLGDRLDSFLVEGSGAGEAIDAFVAADPSGRFLAFERQDRLVLRDSYNQSELDLSERDAATRTDRSPFAPHRAARFSDDGRRMLYLRRRGARESVVVHELETGGEVVIEPGAGLLWRAEFDATGEWVVMRVVDADTNGDGRWDWPYGKPGDADAGCISPVPAYRAPVVPPDKPSVRVAPARGGTARQVRGYLGSFGPFGLLRRSEDRALFVDRPGASSELWSPSACNGRLLHADPARGLLLVACSTEEDPRALRLVTRESHQELDLVVGPFELDQQAPGQPRLVPVYAFPGPGTSVVDLETRQTIALGMRDRVIATRGLNVLVRRKEELFLGDPRGQLARVGQSDVLAPILQEGHLVLAPPWVIDMAEGKVLGSVPAEAIALSRQSAVLLPRAPADAHVAAMGPLSWVHPR